MKPPYEDSFKVLASAITILIFVVVGYSFNISSKMKDAEHEILYLQGQVRALKSDIKHINKIIYGSKLK